MKPDTIAPHGRPLYVMLKPVGAVCNLKCTYCYYREKSKLYPEATDSVMSKELLERFIILYLHSQTMNEVQFTWHGGEPLMRDRSFYKLVLELQRKYGGGRRIENCIQTNGILLTDDWCKFFKDHNFLVGLSIDGPQHCHDIYRRTYDNQATFLSVMKAISLLKKHHVEYNAMAVVNDYNANYPLEFYRFFKNIDCHFIQFAPIVEQVDGKPVPWNVPSEKWGDFLIAIFDEWVRKDVGTFYIQLFDATLANWMGLHPGVCILAKTCGHAGVMEFNGDVYACDHFVFPDYKLGNIQARALAEMMCSDKQVKFGNSKRDALPPQCRACPFLFACNGECPKNRIITTPSGELGLNYLCKGYYKFFEHVAPYMEFMKSELLAERPPSNVMKSFVAETVGKTL